MDGGGILRQSNRVTKEQERWKKYVRIEWMNKPSPIVAHHRSHLTDEIPGQPLSSRQPKAVLGTQSSVPATLPEARHTGEFQVRATCCTSVRQEKRKKETQGKQADTYRPTRTALDPSGP